MYGVTNSQHETSQHEKEKKRKKSFGILYGEWTFGITTVVYDREYVTRAKWTCLLLICF